MTEEDIQEVEESPLDGLDAFVNEDIFRSACNSAQSLMSEGSSHLIFDSNETVGEFERWAGWIAKDASPEYIASFFLHVGISIGLMFLMQSVGEATEEEEPECERGCTYTPGDSGE